MTAEQNHPAGWSNDRLLAACDVVRQRRSGPGGQHRNKVETAVVITHRESGIRAEATERRSQEENRKVALFRLRLRLALLLRREVLGEGASRLWESRRSGNRIRVNENHADFPPLLAEALDHFFHCDDAAAAAAALGITTSQFGKLIGRYPPALAAVNERRRDQGKRPLVVR